MKQVAAAILKEKLPRVTLFDLRSPALVTADGIAGAIPLSLEALQAGEFPDIAKNEPIYLICERGQISELAGLYLEAAGFREVYNISGGMIAWRAVVRSEAIPPP
jgi:rhodanese-related sulfurtransferase